MARYERVNANDEDDDTYNSHLSAHRTPNSPPPSFHSRSPSPTHRVNPDLDDAFDDGDASDDEVDDRQRLVRGNSTPSINTVNQPATPAAPSPHQPAAASASRRVMGGGNGTDGVFANMSARPERPNQTDSEKDEMPPTYEQAAADAAPPYWETTILAPGMGGPDDVYVDGMPVGSVFSFIWNGMISASFLVGFLLTYLLHSTHAAKNGSRAGLGIQLINYGFYMKAAVDDSGPSMTGPDGYSAPPDPNSHNFKPDDVADGGGGSETVTPSEWMAYLLMIVGWFILIRSIADFLRARRHEQLILQSPERGLGVAVVGEGETSERAV